MKKGDGKRSVLMSVPVQRKALVPSTKFIRATDFVRSAIAESSVASPVEQAVVIVHDAAALVNGDSVKWTMAVARTAPGSSATGENTSIICSDPSVHGVHASAPFAGSTGLHSMRPSFPCT